MAQDKTQSTAPDFAEEFNALSQAIYFLKVDELKAFAARAGIKPRQSKQGLIDALLAVVCGAPISDPGKQAFNPRSAKSKALAARFDSDHHIVPGVYRNNATYRARFKQMIGSHFTYTNYGMDWIKQQWQDGKCPTYEAFAKYWQDEFKRRKNSNDFASKPTLQRVNFFRKMKALKLSKSELEHAWQAERTKNAKVAVVLLDTKFPL